MINYHSDLGKSPVYQYYFTLDTDWGKLKAMLELKDMRGKLLCSFGGNEKS